MAIFRITMKSACLQRKVPITVLLPIEEDPGEGEKFQTLYLLHGFEGNQEDWMVRCDLEKISRDNRLAIVLPSAENSFYQDLPGTGGAYGQFVGQELVAFTRACFPLSSKREDTCIGGNSMGGFGALLLGCRFRDNFSKVIALSGAYILENIQGVHLGYKDGIADYDYYLRTFGDLTQLVGGPKDPLYWMRKALENQVESSYYLAIGLDDFLLEENRKMVAEMKKLGAKVTYQESEGGHDWEYWGMQLHKYFSGRN